MIDQMLERYDLLLTIEVRAFWLIAGLYAISLLLHIAHALAHPFYYAKERRLESAAGTEGVRVHESGQLFFGQAAAALLFFTVIVQGLLFILRSYERGTCPIQTRYEGYQLFAWIATLTYLFVRRRWAHIYMPGLLVNLIALAAMLAVPASNGLTPDPAPLPANMRVSWYVWYIGAAFAAYGVLAVSFAIELSCLGARIIHAAHLFRDETRPLVENPLFHRDAYKLALFAFPVLTLAILAGAAWTASVWGHLWTWEYVKTASPVTWIAFGLYLHAKHLRRWRGALASLFNILGFISIVIVFAGPRFLAGLVGLSGLYPPG